MCTRWATCWPQSIYKVGIAHHSTDVTRILSSGMATCVLWTESFNNANYACNKANYACISHAQGTQQPQAQTPTSNSNNNNSAVIIGGVVGGISAGLGAVIAVLVYIRYKVGIDKYCIDSTFAILKHVIAHVLTLHVPGPCVLYQWKVHLWLQSNLLLWLDCWHKYVTVTWLLAQVCGCDLIVGTSMWLVTWLLPTEGKETSRPDSGEPYYHVS